MSFDITNWTADWFSSASTVAKQEFRLWMVEQLKNRVVSVEFTKADSTTRKMNCTLQSEYLPEASFDANQIDESESNASLETIVVWDTDINAWRSFRFDRLINVE